MIPCVAILGAGLVASTTAYTLTLSGMTVANWGSAYAIMRDSVGGIVWAVPSGGEGAPVEGRGARQDNRLFLDGRASVTVFQNLAARPARRFMGPDGACDSMRNEKGGKPLKTNNSAKSLDFAPQ
jgi:hypothetical protein